MQASNVINSTETLSSRSSETRRIVTNLRNLLPDDDMTKIFRNDSVPLTSCQYIDSDNIQSLISSDNDFKILSLNIQSQNSNESDLECLLDSFGVDMSVISLCETAANDKTVESFQLPNYTQYYSKTTGL